jgi:ribosomal protein S12 methylthiotransferase accessory factor
MIAMTASSVSSLSDRLARHCATAEVLDEQEQARRTKQLVETVFAARRQFGITRLGSLTRLDPGGICVVQAVRPLSLSNAVSQGKGRNLIDAAASALMESLETWAAERIDASRVTVATALGLGEDVRSLYSDAVVNGFDPGWDRLPLGWVDGYDLFSGAVRPVPLALVDTVYTHPSPHPVGFPRSTTGLAAGTNLLSAIVHAGLEIIERACVAAAERSPRTHPERRIDAASVSGRLSKDVLAAIEAADLVAGIWLVSPERGLPVYRCHVIEGERHREIAPFPGVGFGCDFTHDRALAKALMEAAQARLTVVAGAREDLTRSAYPENFDRKQLAEWRHELRSPTGAISMAPDRPMPAPGEPTLAAVIAALKEAGAKAAFVVPLFSSAMPKIEVVRVVAPPLRHFGRSSG